MTAVGIIYFAEVPDTALGNLWVACSEKGLAALEWDGARKEIREKLAHRFKVSPEESPRHLARTVSQVREYLLGERKRFTLQIDWSLLRPFQRQVLLATYAIPYGQTTTYSDLAQQIGRPRAARAVGQAQAANPMPIVIPCHRVLGAKGKLRGYGGGLAVKKWLLQLEGAVLA